METPKSYWSLLDVSVTLAGSRAKILTPCWSYSRPCLVEWESLCRLEPSTNIQDCISTQMENLMRFVSVEKSFDVYHYRRGVLFVLAYYFGIIFVNAFQDFLYFNLRSSQAFVDDLS